MNLKRILSSALVVVMLFSAVALLIPIEAKAAHHSSIGESVLTEEQVANRVTKYQKANYTSVEAMFQEDKKNNELDCSTNGIYSIYVNRYTGVLYYRNEITGEMLTSNSYNFKNADTATSAEWASQVSVSFYPISDNTKESIYHSSQWAAARNQIKVSKINNGLRVSYAIGNTATRCLLPVWIEAHEFENDILRPMFKYLYEKMEAYMGEKFALDYFDGNKKQYNSFSGSIRELTDKYYIEEEVYENRYLHYDSMTEFFDDFKDMIDAYTAYAKKEGIPPNQYLPKTQELETIKGDIKILYDFYNPHNPFNENFVPNESTPAKAMEGDKCAIYTVKDPTYNMMADKAKSVKKYTKYTMEMMYEDEEFCGYEHELEINPVFRCALEYTLNDDNSLSVRLPSNSIVFDETRYILTEITPLKYFGAVDFKDNDGYIFVPDGSGAVIEFEDFRDSNVSMLYPPSFYGMDYCYSEIIGVHSQTLTMPVYGMVSNRSANGSETNIGYFAILEEGSSMAKIDILYDDAVPYKEGTVFTSFTPNPSDKFYLSETQSYVKVSESKYSGSYITRYVMLTGNKANYAGMAEYYRNYLEANGTLKAIENVGDDIPLYLEALGSLEVLEKILTFPVNVSKPITTFEDIVTIYNELGNAKAKFEEKASEYDALAAAEDENINLKRDYENTAANYRRLANEVCNIDNINFKLTGFSNGGLHTTYPTKVKWERTVGGKRGFKKLLDIAEEKTGADSNFGVYPEFDFQYISNTSLFDKVGKRNTVSRMVDNRYASKQSYNNITDEYDTLYAMIVSADALDRLYNKFIKKYSKYDATGISVSTLGSDLNSNFDKDNPVSRDDAQGYVTDLLDRIANESNYSVMTSQGNIYAVKYADHILDVCTDSSYYIYSSYTIPFVGMILHGYVNYTGTALNYSGSPAYDFLRSIENGAYIYYTIGYRNTDYMKDDEDYNKYYSISYENWFDEIVENYSVLNENLADLQDAHIVDHKVLIGERVIDESESVANLNTLMNEFIEEYRAELSNKVEETFATLRQQGAYDKRIGIEANIDELVAYMRERLDISVNDAELSEEVKESIATFRTNLEKLVAEFRSEYDTTGVDVGNIVAVEVTASEFDYTSAYKYITDSTAFDEDYVFTDYTVDNNLIVMVTYKKGEKEVSFLLNYNIYDVEVTLADGTTHRLGRYDFKRLG